MMKICNITACAFMAIILMPSQKLNAETNLEKAENVINEVKKKFAPDKRQVIYNIGVRHGKASDIVLDGEISEGWILDSLTKALARMNLTATNSVYVYPSDKWAMSRISVSCLRCNPSNAAEMASQALMGMPLRILDYKSDCYLVQTPDGYIAWVTSSSVVLKTDQEMKAWRESPRYVVTSPYQVRAYVTPKATGVREVVTDLVPGNIISAISEKPQSGRVEIELPDGRHGWINKSDVTSIETWSAQNFNPDVILDQAYSMEGTPYLWGGTSVKTLDCSGLAKVSYLANGIILMRDASQQALIGTRIEAKDWHTCQPGDLLFFGNAKTGRVTHVAIYDHDGNYVHSSGRVKRNSIDPESESYLKTPFLHAVRIHGNEGSAGITYARNHPWYFNQTIKR